jgi:hypothetical protein
MQRTSLSTFFQSALLLAAGAAGAAFLAGLRQPVNALANSTGTIGDLSKLPPGLQAVALTNGSVYIGQLSGYESGMPVLRNVYYVHCEVDKITKAVSNVLVKRGKEWHGPDRMYLNPQHILLMEPVSSTSRVAELVRTARD